jgi:hypothetical protein
LPEVGDQRADVSSLAASLRRDERAGDGADEELEKENARLKKIVAQQAMDIDALKDLNRKNW